jgi:threonine dehydratase
MPIFSPVAKIQATQGYGAEVILRGESFDDALAYAQETAKHTGATFIHPFNDENIIAGQGTIGLEIIERLPSVDVVTVPVGGGGLISGIAIALKQLKPEIEVYGVEAQSAAAMKASLLAGKISEAKNIDTICDGIAVKKPGNLTFNIANDLLDGVVTVNEFMVTRALYSLLERAKIVVEPAGCVGLAAYLNGLVDVCDKNAVAVLSGGNVDMGVMSRIVEKELFRLGQSVRVRGVISDRVGSLNKVLGIVAESRINVLKVEQDRLDPDIAPNKVELELVLEVQNDSAVNLLLDQMRKAGLEFKVFED